MFNLQQGKNNNNNSKNLEQVEIEKENKIADINTSIINNVHCLNTPITTSGGLTEWPHEPDQSVRIL